MSRACGERKQRRTCYRGCIRRFTPPSLVLLSVALLAGACSSGNHGHIVIDPGKDAGDHADTGGGAEVGRVDAGNDRAEDAGTASDVPTGADADDPNAYPTPVAVQVPRASAPTPLPAGTKVVCLTSDTDTTMTSTCWVIKWGGWTYWVLSDVNNQNELIIAPFDSSGALATQGTWPLIKPGARYPWRVTVDNGDQTVTIFGQGGANIVVAWSELRIDQPVAHTDGGSEVAMPDIPTVFMVAESAAPAPPAGARVTCLLAMNDTHESPVCPVVRWGRWTYWVFTDTVTGYGFVVTPYDASGAIATQSGWPKTVGDTRYIWQIGVDTGAMTVTFIGQGMTPAMMTWDELRIDQP